MANIARGAAPGTGAMVGYGTPASRVDRALDGVPEDELFTLTLNGTEVQARAGETIMDVCHRNDTYVPHYCWHPSLSIAGNCRLCLVEVEKVPKPIIACQTQVTPGMVVRTQSEVAKTAQEWMMEFLLVNHPLDCPICDRGGECQLQRYSMEYGTPHTRMADKKRKFIKPQADPLIDIERNRCIMCTRCVRFCDEVGGEHVMGVFDRGSGNYIGTFGQGPVSNIFSGNVIDLCPVGCLTSRPYRFKARPWELKQTQTTCDLCSSGCKVTKWTRNGKLYRTTPPSRQRHDHFTINEDTEEFICNQGRFGSDYTSHESRCDENQVGRAGRLAPTSFGEAVREGAAKLREVAERHGPESIAVAVSPKATLEEGWLATVIARQLGTPSIDWRGTFASARAADAVSLALDLADGDLAEEPDVVLVVNGDLVHQSPVLALRLQELARRFEKKVYLLGNTHCRYLSEHARGQFFDAPGETAGSLGLLKAAVGGDAAAIPELAGRWGIDPSKVEGLVRDLSEAGRGLVVQGLEDFAGLYAPAEVPAAAGLRNALGEGWGFLPVVCDRNAVGLHAVGCEPSDGGVAAPDLARAMNDGTIKGVFAVGSDALENLGDGVASVLGKLDVLVLASTFESEITQGADVVLALASSLERTGVYADIEGNLALNKQAEEAIGDAREGWEILAGIANALGADLGPVDSAESAWALVRKVLAPESTCTLANIELVGSTNDAHFYVHEPAGGARNRGTDYNPGNYRTDGLHLRGDASRLSAGPPADGVADVPEVGDDELLMVWGRHVSGDGFESSRSSVFGVLQPKPFLDIHVKDARRLGVEDGQFVVLQVGGSRAKAAVRTGFAVAPGCAYLPAGVYGAYDPASQGGPVAVGLEALDEFAPTQDQELLEAVGDSAE